MKVCTQCKEEKSEADYIKVATTRHSMCDPCRKAYQRAYNKKRKEVNTSLW